MDRGFSGRAWGRHADHACLFKRGGESEVVWEVTMSVGVAELTNEVVSVTLTDEPIYDQPSVLLRHDPQTSPGLF